MVVLDSNSQNKIHIREFISIPKYLIKQMEVNGQSFHTTEFMLLQVEGNMEIEISSEQTAQGCFLHAGLTHGC